MSISPPTPVVVLVNPPPCKVVDPHDNHSYTPSIAIAYLAAALLAKGITPICIDGKQEGLDYEKFAERIKTLSTVDFIGVTSMTHNIFDAHDVVRIVKKYFPNALAIVGGCHVTALPVRTLVEFELFDIAVVGEGEETLPDLIKTCWERKPLSGVKGIVYREADGLKETECRPLVEDLDSLPYPIWHLFSVPPTELQVLASRRCPFQCNFCQRVLGNRVRLRSPQKVVAEIKYMVERFGVTRVGFPDETLTINKKWLHEILQVIKKENLHRTITWAASCRVDTVDESILAAMKDAGCVLLGFGVESGNEEILKNSGKGITKKQVETAIKAAQRLGITVLAFFILGNPNETVQTANETIHFAARLNPTFAAFGIMVPYPGTKIREMALKGEGGYCWVSENWRDYGKNIGHPLELSSLSRRQLMRLQLKGYLYLYFMNFRFIEFFKVFLDYRKTIFSVIGGWFRRAGIRKR